VIERTPESSGVTPETRTRSLGRIAWEAGLLSLWRAPVAIETNIAIENLAIEKAAIGKAATEKAEPATRGASSYETGCESNLRPRTRGFTHVFGQPLGSDVHSR